VWSHGLARSCFHSFDPEFVGSGRQAARGFCSLYLIFTNFCLKDRSPVIFLDSVPSMVNPS
jgi:hypothetical protein